MKVSEHKASNGFLQKMLILSMIAVIVTYLGLSSSWKLSNKLLSKTANHPPIWDQNNDDLDNSDEKFHDQFAVFTPSCQIPNIDPFDETILSYYNKVDPIKCTKKGGRLTYTIDNYLIFDEEVAKTFTALTCCIRNLRRIDGKSDNKFKIGKKCRDWNKRKSKLEEEFVKVECMDKNKTVVYKNYHAVAVLNDRSKSKMNHKSKNDFSVAVIGLDAVSRLNFHRHMDKTKKILFEELDAIELLGYNKVGDNTFPNAVPMLLGVSTEELKNICWKNGMSFDNCTFIWKEFSSKGYLTSYAEDTPSISIFNYIKEGFFKQPTDHYLRPLILAAENDIGYLQPMNCKMCIGPNTQIELILKYTSDILKFYNSKHQKNIFSFSWTSSLTHDYLNYAGKADPFLFQFFKNITEIGVLDDTIMIFVSDHGLRWGGIVSTDVGKLEERLPFTFIYLPPKFKEKYPEKVKALRTNARRLTTPFDIYHTLRNIMNIDDVYKVPNNTKIKTYGQSLFEVIDKNRTCQSAGIPMSWCTCLNSTEVDKNSEGAKKAAMTIINKINGEFKKHKIEKQCYKLSLSKVLSASIKISNDNVATKKKPQKYYTIAFETIPGNAHFEATVKVNGNMFHPSNQIGRTNLYRNQSHCINVLAAKKFCYCKKKNEMI